MKQLFTFPSIGFVLGVASWVGAVAHAAPALEFKKNERIALLGNSLAERMNLYGHFEALLHSRFAAKELVVRNFAWPCDEVGMQQRPNDYTKIDDPLEVFGAETFLCFFGYNESFAGAAGIDKFKADYEKFIVETGRKYGRGGTARFVLISPIAFENTGDPFLPSGAKENENLKLYTAAIADVATKLSLPFANLFEPSARRFAEEPGAQFTINGAHVNERGDRAVAEWLDQALFSGTTAGVNSPRFESLRAAVNDKSWTHAQDYRMLNGWYVYGGRRTWDLETFPREYKKIRAMGVVRDRYVWDVAQDHVVSAAPDDSGTGDLFVPKTRFGVPQQSYSEPKELRYVSGEESIKDMTVADGFEVTLFASEETFPQLAKPTQLNFDNKGRLWVACMPTYPQWKPGDPKPSDRLLIFEDTDHDGKADRCKVFANDLHCPTGFEFWNGGVLVMSQPRMVFLKDTDGDDRADQVTYLTDGWATDDTHHTMGAFEWSNGGLLHGLEGVAVSTIVETPWGPFRNKNTPGAYVVDPRTHKIRHFITPGYGNPWCYVFNGWGQGIVGDGTTSQFHWDTPLNTAQIGQRKGLNVIFNNEGMRPALGAEFLRSRHLPDSVQNQFVYGCVINMNGIPRFEIHDDGAGYGGSRMKKDGVNKEGKPAKVPDDLVISTDRNFRPGETQIGPDGAVWFLDWHNPLIGHMQYSQRDPNRDHAHGRLYRLTAKGRPLLDPVIQYGKSVAELMDQLKAYEPRTRYRARRELRDRPAGDVVPETKRWVAKLDSTDPNYDLYRVEALWVQVGHHAVKDDYLATLLRAEAPDARAVAVHVLNDEWDYLSNPMELLRPMVNDPHPRVRVEALRALSFRNSTEAAELALEVTKHPTDYWIDYTLQHTITALESNWKPAHQSGELAKNNPAGREYLDAFIRGQPSLGFVKEQLKRLIDNPTLAAPERNKLISAIAKVSGREREGRFVFERVCTSCHKVQNFGIDYGPELTKVASRMKRDDLIESILYPNEKVEPKWLTTNITTKDGQEFSGVVSAEDDATVTLKLGGDMVQKIAKSNIEKRETLKVSNMPEGLAASLAPQEFVDLIEYLAARK